ncbi:MAG: GTPase ObgE [Oscillospiraceae bacterium]|nr:GTPase ObgE [Oscillospiraceae bacterium]
MFEDIARITVKAGDGGAGAVSFRREKYVAAGGPDGGDGGRGGDVVFVADTNISNLATFKYKKRYFAPDGVAGAAKRCNGKDAEDLIIKVPKGTLVTEAETGRVVADISGDEPVVIAKGGKGGWGNSHFATSTRQVPRFAKPGMPGQKLDLQLELKLLADVGLVGYPNVGKSTLISVCSAAKPKIANYPFTTLTPVLGVVSVDAERSFVMADIPGLIEGAGDGVGLGHEFLRHVERCRLILHIVDVSGSEARDPKEDYEIICRELRSFNPELADRPQIVAANKCDMATPEQIADFKKFIEDKGYLFFELSAITHQGVMPLINAVSRELEKLPPIKVYEPEPEALFEPEEGSLFDVYMDQEVYVVDAPWLPQVIGSVNMEDYESLQYFQRVLRKSGIIDKLEEMGINEGDTVRIFEFEFDYVR